VAWALDEVRTPSLFGERKVVVIDNADAAEPAGAAPKAGKRKVDGIGALAAAVLASPPTGAALVLRTSRGVKGKTAVDAEGLQELGAVVVDCRALYDAPAPWETSAPAWDHELGRFLGKRMKVAHGKALGVAEAHAVTRKVGSDMAALDAALKSLALWLGERPKVEAKDVEEALGVTREDPVWTLVDAVLDRDLGKALDLTAAAFDRGISDERGAVVVRPDALFPRLVGSLHASYRRLLLGAEALARGERTEEVARAAGVAPFLAQAFVSRCRRDPADLLARHGAFLEAETGVRGGGVPPRLAFERLVIRLAAP
jgi:hypothetical protein